VIVERRPSDVGTERVEALSPAVVFDGQRDELVIGIGHLDVKAVAYEVVSDVEIQPPDFVAVTIRKFTRVLGEERIERLVVFERQPMTYVTRMTDPQTSGYLDDDDNYVFEKIIPAHQVWAYFGRYGFVAFLKWNP
jgi:hypothetical protein